MIFNSAACWERNNLRQQVDEWLQMRQKFFVLRKTTFYFEMIIDKRNCDKKNVEQDSSLSGSITKQKKKNEKCQISTFRKSYLDRATDSCARVCKIAIRCCIAVESRWKQLPV